MDYSDLRMKLLLIGVDIPERYVESVTPLFADEEDDDVNLLEIKVSGSVIVNLTYIDWILNALRPKSGGDK